MCVCVCQTEGSPTLLKKRKPANGLGKFQSLSVLGEMSAEQSQINHPIRHGTKETSRDWVGGVVFP